MKIYQSSVFQPYFVEQSGTSFNDDENDDDSNDSSEASDQIRFEKRFVLIDNLLIGFIRTKT